MSLWNIFVRLKISKSLTSHIQYYLILVSYNNTSLIAKAAADWNANLPYFPRRMWYFSILDHFLDTWSSNIRGISWVSNSTCNKRNPHVFEKEQVLRIQFVIVACFAWKFSDACMKILTTYSVRAWWINIFKSTPVLRKFKSFLGQVRTPLIFFFIFSLI